MPPWHPIILLKSNLFNMATVMVKRSIGIVLNEGETMQLWNCAHFRHPTDELLCDKHFAVCPLRILSPCSQL